MTQKNNILKIIDNISEEIKQVKKLTTDMLIYNKENETDESKIQFGQIFIDYKKRIISKGNFIAKLTQREFELCEILTSRINEVITYEDICKELYELEIDDSMMISLYTLTSRLRTKVNPVFEIQALRNKGLILSLR